MKKLLFITPELPYPAQSGGKVKSIKLLHSLATRYDVTLACPLKKGDSEHLDEFLKVSPCTKHLHESVNVPRTPLNLAISYAKRIPLNVYRTASKPLVRSIESIAEQYDIIFLDHFEVYPYLPSHYRGLTIYHAHNAYFKMWKRYAQLPGNPAMRAAAWLESKRVKNCESAVAKSTAITFAAPNDVTELLGEGVPPSKLHNTYHLGDDSQLFLPDLRFSDSEEKLMYVGFLGWEPNSQGLIWFIQNVWPLVKAQHPNLTFDIVGKDADARLYSLVESNKGITLKGFVPNLQDVYRQARVSVAPLLFGSGMKVKVLDSLSRGMPTVTTSVGAEGIATEADQHLLVADEPSAMAHNIHRLLTDELLWKKLQRSSRALVKQHYTWEKLFAQMHQDIEDELHRADGTLPQEHLVNVS